MGLCGWVCVCSRKVTCSCGELGSYIMANTNKQGPFRGAAESQQLGEFTALSLNSLEGKYTKGHRTKKNQTDNMHGASTLHDINDLVFF